MSDRPSTASLLYPSMAPASPTPGAPAAPAAAGRPTLAEIMYPSAAPSQAVPVPQARAQPAATPAANAAPVAPAEPAQPRLSAAAVMYPDHGIFDGNVNLSEGAAHADDYRLDVPAALRNDTPAARAEEQAARQAMAGVGLGGTMASELWNSVVAASQAPPVTTTPEQALAALRQSWGPQTDSKLATAKAAFADYRNRDPAGALVLEKTGLTNDAAFIRKITAAAERIAGRGK